MEYKNLQIGNVKARIKIIEKDKSRAEFIANELNNSIVINGNGLDEDVLSEANLEEVETPQTNLPCSEYVLRTHLGCQNTPGDHCAPYLRF